ncbi:hypothetical protein BGZ52_010180 [Haplosporangium bisporale]|nr:hypothetical protein BGZ52_010180 [Haplosporangium bisporale]
MTTTPTARNIQRIVQARGVADGVGTIVQRTIGGDDLESLDPFLTLDEFRMTKPTPSKGSKATSSKKEAGFPDHPHRGFETVTLMLEGHFQHQDFTGRQGTIGPGDVQWMTAGRGIVHAEMPYFPEESGKKNKGASSAIWGLQLWSKDTTEGETPSLASNTLEPNTTDDQQEKPRVPAFQRTSFLDIETTDESCHFVLIAGEPCREPVFRQGPFVMNSKEELERTFRDYEEKKRGFERAKDWVSTIGQQASLSVSQTSPSSNFERGQGRRGSTASESANGSRKKPSENRRKGK